MLTFRRKTAVGIIYRETPLAEKEFLVAVNFKEKNIFPGGGIGRKETPRQAFFRELEEETGIGEEQLNPANQLDKNFYFTFALFGIFQIQTEQHFFLAKLKESCRLRPNWEIKKFYWLKKKETGESLSYDSMKEAFRYVLFRYF